MSIKTYAWNPGRNFRLQKTKTSFRIFLMLVPQHVKETMVCEDGAIHTDGCTRVVDGETVAGWGVIARSLHGRIDIMHGLVVTTETISLSQVSELTPTPLK